MVTQKKDERPTPRQIVGISLAPEMAGKFKAEAGRRNLSLRKLFEEIWEQYESNIATDGKAKK